MPEPFAFPPATIAYAIPDDRDAFPSAGFNGSPWALAPSQDKTLKISVTLFGLDGWTPSASLSGSNGDYVSGYVTPLRLWLSQPAWLYPILEDAIPRLRAMLNEARATALLPPRADLDWPLASPAGAQVGA